MCCCSYFISDGGDIYLCAYICSINLNSLVYRIVIIEQTEGTATSE